MNDDQKMPHFRVDKESVPPKVILQCSKCEKDIREIKENESIRVTRAYYCDECDDGTIVLNPSMRKDDE